MKDSKRAEQKSAETEDLSEEDLIRLKKLDEIRKPIIEEVMAENPGLTREQVVKMMDEMGF